MKKLIALIIIFTLAAPNVQAQFFKKLKKKVEEKVENTVTENVSDKAAGETEKSLNNMWEKSLSNSAISFGAERVDPALIPESYDFNWEYTMEMSTREGAMEMVYLLQEDAPYVGFKIPQAQSMVTVLDNANDLTVIFMNSGQNNMVMASKIDVSNAESEEMQNQYKDIKMEEIGTKEILGYTCQGYRAENEGYIYEFYVTDEAGLSFTDLFQTNQKKFPRGFDAEWLKLSEGLMMEMQMNDKNNPQKSVSMTCTNIQKKDFVIKKANYTAIGG
ncbi:DUF4412 domain-containing protein [Salinimicrobium sp. GXAS 041]|uniref:DUF4412 domain-containing protein n=1 Tax=Salinimicrobium sp. GXAS 041 TaxID=3400806 RepID=UPI003C71AB95